MSFVGKKAAGHLRALPPSVIVSVFSITTGTDRSPSLPLRYAPCYLHQHLGQLEFPMYSAGKESAKELSQSSLESNMIFSFFLIVDVVI